MGDLRIPVLTYHANNISGTDYADNDHTALKSDLYALHEAGYLIIPLLWVAQWLQGQRDLSSLKTQKLIALSCDDGINLDFVDGEYLSFGHQTSFHHILADFQQDVGTKHQPHAHMTCFVIASAKARQMIEQSDRESAGMLSDDWWAKASSDQLFSIENHSWDHRHPAIYEKPHARFCQINTTTLADQQIRFASEQIEAISAVQCQLFCYPFGDHNDFLVKDYFPNNDKKHQLTGAFSCEPSVVTKNSNPWCIPRFVCGLHWQTADEFKQLILSASG